MFNCNSLYKGKKNRINQNISSLKAINLTPKMTARFPCWIFSVYNYGPQATKVIRRGKSILLLCVLWMLNCHVMRHHSLDWSCPRLVFCWLNLLLSLAETDSHSWVHCPRKEEKEDILSVTMEIYIQRWFVVRCHILCRNIQVWENLQPVSLLYL